MDTEELIDSTKKLAIQIPKVTDVEVHSSADRRVGCGSVNVKVYNNVDGRYYLIRYYGSNDFEEIFYSDISSRICKDVLKQMNNTILSHYNLNELRCILYDDCIEVHVYNETNCKKVGYLHTGATVCINLKEK